MKSQYLHLDLWDFLSHLPVFRERLYPSEPCMHMQPLLIHVTFYSVGSMLTQNELCLLEGRGCSWSGCTTGEMTECGNLCGTEDLSIIDGIHLFKKLRTLNDSQIRVWIREPSDFFLKAKKYFYFLRSLGLKKCVKCR